MHVFRLAKRKYRRDLWDGVGGMFADGRWTRRGHPVVYAAGSIALAVLEYTVHYKRRGWIPATVLGRAEIPDSIDVAAVTTEQLPGNWRDPEPPEALRELGDRWLARAEYAVLRVPSALVPEEPNILLNPAHPDFERITKSAAVDFLLDRRLARAKRR